MKFIAFSRFETNGMFYFDRETSKKMFAEMSSSENEGLEYLRKKYWGYAKFLKMKPGIIPTLASSEVITPGQLGPINFTSLWST